LPGQQALPGVPQVRQRLPLQMAFGPLQVPLPPLALAQQGEPRSPHLVQLPPLHVMPAAVHTPVAGDVPQQG
jgi:hypothetical protein